MNYQCAVTQDLHRHLAARRVAGDDEAWKDANWPELKKSLAAQLESQQPIRIADHRGERTLISWSDVTYDAACRQLFIDALEQSLTDEAEAGKMMAQAVRDEIDEKVEAHKDDLLDDYRRGLEDAA